MTEEVQALRQILSKIEEHKEVLGIKRDINLIAVTKTISPDRIASVVKEGILDLGENKVQELRDKIPIFPQVRWHFIGYLQSNKVKYIIDDVYMIHSLDRWSLAEEINKRALEKEKRIKVLVQVNVSGEQTKSGLQPNEVMAFIKKVAALPGIEIKGLMTMAPYTSEQDELRDVFRGLVSMRDSVLAEGLPQVEMEFLSMGMSNDYLIAIEEGSNMIRLGSEIFGERNY